MKSAPLRALLPVLALSLASVTGAARADLVLTDWKVPGDQLLLWDTQTNLQWLNLTVTQGASYYSTLALLGGAYQGFRYADTNTVWTLFAHANISPSYPAPAAPTMALVSQWGATDSVPNTYYLAFAIISDENTYMPGYQLVAGVGSLNLSGNEWYANATSSAVLPTQGISIYGSALIRDYAPLAVPEVSTWGLLLLGLLPVALRSRTARVRNQ